MLCTQQLSIKGLHIVVYLFKGMFYLLSHFLVILQISMFAK